MKRNKLMFTIYAAGVMLLLLYSMRAYFLWFMYESPYFSFAFDLIVAITGFAYMLTSNISIRLNKSIIIPFLVLWIASVWNPFSSLFIVFKIPFTFLTLLILDKQSLRKLLNIWTKLYAIILLVSLIAWPLAFIGVLPSRGIIQFGEEDGYMYQNFGLVLINMNFFNFDVVRFCSIFLEPGHVSMIGAFTLYINRFDFKKWTTWVIFIVSLITLSLAGYVLMALGYVLLRMQSLDVRKGITAIFGFLVLIGISYLVAANYNKGNNLVNTLIFERLEYDEEKGVSGNNRVTKVAEGEFERFISSPAFFTGMSAEEYMRIFEDSSSRGAGYMMYLMEKGLIGTLIVFFGYWLIANRALDKRFVKNLLLLYFFAFLQRAWPTQPIWLYLFVFATALEPVKITRKISVR